MTFEIGARIKTRAKRRDGHTRLPGYLERKPGVVHAAIGTYPLPDENARDPVHARSSRLYTVEFRASDIWGEGADGRIYADLFEDYLEEAP